jgi:hypothetical protein
MLELSSSVCIISLIANIICNVMITNLLMRLTPEELMKDPPKSLGYMIAVAMLSKITFYISLTLTMASLISKILL